MALTRRQQVLGGLLVGTGVLTLVLLADVIETVFFAITVAYVLYPIRRRLYDWGVPRRIAAALAATVGFVFTVAVVTPIVVALYLRRDELLKFIQNVPAEQPVTLFGMTYVVDVSQLLVRARDAVIDAGVNIASAAPVLALKGFLFLILLFGLLLRPGSVRRAAVRIVPGEYHDVVFALHHRVRDTLYALYVLQAATALGTFVVAYVVFWALGYNAAFSLSIFAGILQFIPVLGPSILVVAIAAGQLLAGEVVAAVLVVVFGLVLVGFLPDAVIRPRLATVTTGMPASLYFVGFTGGTLTIGVVGVIAGPLVVALLVEVVELVTDERTSVQQTLDDAMGDDRLDRDDRDDDGETSRRGTGPGDDGSGPTGGVGPTGDSASSADDTNPTGDTGSTGDDTDPTGSVDPADG
jgi:predicted PurR-regulated permease PerM